MFQINFKLASKKRKGNNWLTLLKSPETDLSQQDLESRRIYLMTAINADQCKTISFPKTSWDYFLGNLVVQFLGVNFVDDNSCDDVKSWMCLDWICSVPGTCSLLLTSGSAFPCLPAALFQALPSADNWRLPSPHCYREGTRQAMDLHQMPIPDWSLGTGKKRTTIDQFVLFVGGWRGARGADNLGSRGINLSNLLQNH